MSPLTIYRWELPADATEARRPRGEIGRRVVRMLGEQGTPDLARVLAASRDLSFGKVDVVERGLVDALATGTLQTDAARAAAAAVLARLRMNVYGDHVGAIAMVAPWVARADEEGWPKAARVEVLMADLIATSSPHGRLLDADRVAARLRTLRLLSPPGADPVVDIQLAACEATVAFYLGDSDLALQVPIPEPGVALPPLEEGLRLEFQGHAAFVRGHGALALERMTAAARLQTETGFAFHAARCHAFVGLRLLDDAQAPVAALAAAARAREQIASVVPGHHLLVLARVEGEAHLRAGDFGEAEAALRAGIQVAEATAWPPHMVAGSLMRLLLHTRRIDEGIALAQRLQVWEGRVQQALTRAYGFFYEGWLRFHLWTEPARAVALLEQASAYPSTSPTARIFRREALIWAAAALGRIGREAEAAEAFAQVDRLLEQLPSTWMSGLARRARGQASLRQNDLESAAAHLEASRAAFAVAGDAPEGIVARRMLAEVRLLAGDPGAEEELDATELALGALGMPLAPRLSRDAIQARVTQWRRGPLPLAVAVERVALRGLGRGQVISELVAVLGAIGAEGVSVASDGVGAPGAPAPGMTWLETGDGLGGRLRVGAHAPTPEVDMALRVLVPVAGLALELAALRGTAEPPVAEPEGELVAVSPGMRRMRDEVARLGASRATVLLSGESGTGKEVVARALHQRSTRAGAPLVTFNCAAVPRDLFESQLFGHKRGAFTGAQADNPGVIRAADRGTLFLDEIGELPLDVQPKLLRFLENGEILPLGERRPIRVDVRVIAATHRDLAREVAEGRFREDLYYRLNVVPLRIPPLRDRPEDVAPLARLFLRRASTDGRVPVLAPDALHALRARPWPGNARELRNVMERLMAYSPVPTVIVASMVS